MAIFSQIPLKIIAANKMQLKDKALLKHNAAELLLEEENYKGLKRDRGMVERNH